MLIATHQELLLTGTLLMAACYAPLDAPMRLIDATIIATEGKNRLVEGRFNILA
jgi:hypothetical protein